VTSQERFISSPGGDGGRRLAAVAEERRSRHHPRVHQIETAPKTGSQTVDIWGQCYKTFYGRNLQIFVIS